MVALALCCAVSVYAQDNSLDAATERRLKDYFLNYKLEAATGYAQARMKSYRIDNRQRIVTITANDAFAAQDFTAKMVSKIYRKVSRILPSPYDTYKIRIAVNGVTIDLMVDGDMADPNSIVRAWGNIDYKGNAWVRNVSRPFDISRGLGNRHLTVYASHGRFYDQKKGRWRWQRPSLFATTEDLFTPTIVVPYLIPMLENAGANVFTPRERDWQPNEVIVDNNRSSLGAKYEEVGTGSRQWKDTEKPGFSFHDGLYSDHENPFIQGTARQVKTTKSKSKISIISYTPDIPEAGRYAVYVSYQTVEKSVDDAEYIVCHKGQETRFRVNQQMGGGTWVYLGTFDFDKGCNEYNRVVVTNHASRKGVVTTDAVRFGGGMGNIERNGTTSGMPRAMEAARYCAQWSGVPYAIYSTKDGADDYADDINVRPLTTNWLAGGSVYMPYKVGKNVPIELSLAVHSDAGYSYNGKDLVGSLAICTTGNNEGVLNAGIPRSVSKTFAKNLLDGISADLKAKYGRWVVRYLWDRNYSETRNPEIPSAILETLSHQNFPDMAYAQDPNFKFTLARSIYKTILKYTAAQHGTRYTVQPLAPRSLRTTIDRQGKITLTWEAQTDPRESTAMPSAYVVYTRSGGGGFDNGTVVSSTSYTMTPQPGTQYDFKVTAINDGGESFASPIVSALYESAEAKTVLVINGFDRLSAPQVVDDGRRQGFDLDADPGVSYGLTAWNGRQTCFNVNRMGVESPTGLGYGGEEMAGLFVAGNDFSYVATHTSAIASGHKYNVVSCDRAAIDGRKVALPDYSCVDLILGMQRYTPYAVQYYKTFTPAWQEMFRAYTQQGGRLLVSGSYIGSDMQNDGEQQFLSSVLQLEYHPADSVTAEPAINGLGMTFDIGRRLNRHHYAATRVEILHPQGQAYCAMQYADGTSAAVAYDGAAYKSFVMGFPFECIQSPATRNLLMQGIMQFLQKQ